VGIDVADADPEQAIMADKPKKLMVRRHTDLRQLEEKTQNNVPLPKTTQREFADHKWMNQNRASVQ
jgi:hypothetical protein